ncbi:hypothetical protein SAMN04488082_102410 [Desulfomicrobium apsheronum]|uniref:Uncharacterized protein n=1 Tax=Desulfomicrobium apsheronum TaxID=52560 RepID=A0A1I3QQX7_9BACT|nr:hypothetical protein [Desulfomicrobium apsheronum]SFJ35842.1 hypothetical protein SAMN04488082_102410 [Desulfomicrobium apsheronum]
MTEKSYHYLFLGCERTSDFNQQMFKLGQQPMHWISKGMRLKRDADIFYNANESVRVFIVSELERANFKFSRFYRWQLHDGINKILSNNQDSYLPDFDTYYLLVHLSLENLFKGIWLDKFPNNIGFSKLPDALNTHNLIRLAKDIELELSEQEKLVLSKLMELFLGYGRYPIKNRAKEAAGECDLDFGERPYDTVCIECLTNPYNKDRQIIDALFAEQLQERIDLVFIHGHKRMISTFEIHESKK